MATRLLVKMILCTGVTLLYAVSDLSDTLLHSVLTRQFCNIFHSNATTSVFTSYCSVIQCIHSVETLCIFRQVSKS